MSSAQVGMECRQDTNLVEVFTESDGRVLDAYICMQEMKVSDLNVMQGTVAAKDTGAQVPVAMEEEGRIVIH